MRIIVHRLDQKRYRSVVERDDGVRYLVNGFGFMARLPHDLVHYVVESELGLPDGFWGCVAEGAVFESMTWLYGRRRPHATERGRALIKANDDPLTAAEILTAVFAEALEKGLNGGEIELAGELHRRWTGRPGRGGGIDLGREFAIRVCAALRDMTDRWEQTPIGGTLTLAWNPRRQLQRPGKRGYRG